MKKYFTTFTLLFGLLSYSQAVKKDELKKYNNEFLSIGVDAAALAMGNTMVAHTKNAYSTYWNPAGLVNLKNNEVGLMHASYFANIAQYDHVSYAHKITGDSLTIGVGLTRFGIDNILNTTDLIDQNGQVDYNRIKKFSAVDYALNFAGGYKIPDYPITVGLNAKILYRSIGDFASAWGYGLDAGMQYKTPSNWQLGFMLKDFTFTQVLWSFNQEEIDKIQAIPGNDFKSPDKRERTIPQIQLGIAKEFHFKYDLDLLASAQLNTNFYQSNSIISTKGISIDPSVGVELGYKKFAFLRAGLNNMQNNLTIDDDKEFIMQPNIGVGFFYKGISVDYALTNIASQGGGIYSNIFSFRVDLNVFNK